MKDDAEQSEAGWARLGLAGHGSQEASYVAVHEHESQPMGILLASHRLGPCYHHPSTWTKGRSLPSHGPPPADQRTLHFLAARPKSSVSVKDSHHHCWRFDHGLLIGEAVALSTRAAPVALRCRSHGTA